MMAGCGGMGGPRRLRRVQRCIVGQARRRTDTLSGSVHATHGCSRKSSGTSRTHDEHALILVGFVLDGRRGPLPR